MLSNPHPMPPLLKPSVWCRNAEGFVGLKNGSATCYMNAVFQQLFMAPGLRTAVLAEPEEPAATRKESVFYQMQVWARAGSHMPFRVDRG